MKGYSCASADPKDVSLALMCVTCAGALAAEAGAGVGDLVRACRKRKDDVRFVPFTWIAGTLADQAGAGLCELAAADAADGAGPDRLRCGGRAAAPVRALPRARAGAGRRVCAGGRARPTFSCSRTALDPEMKDQVAIVHMVPVQPPSCRSSNAGTGVCLDWGMPCQGAGGWGCTRSGVFLLTGHHALAHHVGGIGSGAGWVDRDDYKVAFRGN